MGILSDIIPNLTIGFATALTVDNIMYCFIGVLCGTLVGVLPGIGPMAAITMLLPVTFNIPAVPSIIMLAGIYYGAQYGGSTTSILVNLPGEPSSVVTCLEGYQMAKKGMAGPALAIAAIGSFTAGTICTVAIALVAPPVAEIALKFMAPEFFSLMVLGLIASAILASGSILKGIAMIFMGLIFGTVGADVTSGMYRFTFGITGLMEGLSIAVVAMGLFGFAEILSNLEKGKDATKRTLLVEKVDHIYPNRKDLKISAGPILRGTGIGAFFGVLPGVGPTIGAFSSYAMEKKLTKNPEEFGKGAIQGVAGPESANNAAAQCAFIPMLTLGIPSTPTMALILGALIIQGIAPGPQVMSLRPELFWGVIASMWIGNCMLLILNLPLIGLWVRLLQVPYRFLFPGILTLMAIGIYSLNNLALDIYFTIFFGLLGYVFMKLKCEPAPLILAFVLGPMMEENLRRALLISKGNPLVFLTRPISATFLLIVLLLLIVMIIPRIRRKRDVAVAEEKDR